MTDTEKVIKGLRCCSEMSGEHCRKCPYQDECRDGYGIPHLANDALELLEKRCNTLNALEQRCKALDAYETARLMTWEEVLKIAEHNYNAKWDEMENVWLEGHESLIFGFAEPQKMGSYIELFTAGDECGYDCEESEYMKKYRCWTNRPTKEQRAVKWE